MKNRILIFGNGERWKEALRLLKSDDFIIGVDAAAFYLLKFSINPHVAIGDFDSVTQGQFRKIKQIVPEVISVNPHPKYKSDLELAVEYALTLKPKEVLFLWSTGKRFDQILANFYLLEILLNKNSTVSIIDQYSRVELVDKRLVLSKTEDYAYVSVLSVTKHISVSMRGFLYNVENYKIKRGQTRGLSNELNQNEGEIDIHEGIAAVIRSRD